MNGEKESKKERRETARQARIEAQRARERARRRKLLLRNGLILILVVGLGAYGFTRWQSGDRAQDKARADAGCSGIKEVEEMATANHVAETDPPPKYNTNPPTSGDHFGSTAPWGALDETVDRRMLVHNLEHGGIVVHFKDLPDSEAEALEDLADETPSGLVSYPDEEIDKPIAMAAWGHLETCERYNERVIRDFANERCNKGPEKPGLGCNI